MTPVLFCWLCWKSDNWRVVVTNSVCCQDCSRPQLLTCKLQKPIKNMYKQVQLGLNFEPFLEEKQSSNKLMTLEPMKELKERRKLIFLRHRRRAERPVQLTRCRETPLSGTALAQPAGAARQEKRSFAPTSRQLLSAVRSIAPLGECESAVGPAGVGSKFWILFSCRCFLRPWLPDKDWRLSSNWCPLLQFWTL